MANHYVRVDVNNIVIKGFTTDFEQPILGDILLPDQDSRHFQIELVSPPPRSQFIYKLENGSMVARTQTEIDVEWNSRPTPPPTELELLKAENDTLNLNNIAIWEALIPLIP